MKPRDNISPTFPPALVAAFLMLVVLLAFGIAGNMGYQDEQNDAALACTMVKIGKWPVSYCHGKDRP
jgi:hypothetical protein